MRDESVQKSIEREEGVKRTVGGIPLRLMNITAVLLSLFTLYTAVFGIIGALQFRSIHLLLAFTITFLLYPASRRQARGVPWWDYLILAASVFSVGYFLVFNQEIESRIFFVTPLTPAQYAASISLLLLLVEATRRVAGWLLPGLAILLILYALVGHVLPPSIGHPGSDFANMLEQMAMTSEGVFGSVLGIVATYVAMFVLLACFLDLSGTGQFFIDLALGITGSMRGGAAKTAVVASGLFGTISGSAVANVVSTGTFTIPLMKGIGYRPQFAGAVEAVASTGGQFMPPVMAATAFIMADFLGVPYLRVAGAAAIPAILYYFAVYVMIDREALKMNLKALPRDELPRVIKVLNQWYLSLPLWMIIYALLAGYSPMKAGLYAWYVSIGLMVLKGWKRFSIRDFLRAMENGSKNLMPVSITCACAGIIVGMIILTGLGLKISGMVLLLSGGSIFMALLLTAFACLILGMGLPTLPAYLVAVSITIPALAKLGVQPLAAHMFVFYFSIISCITPPVAIAAYAAAAISKSNPMKVGWEAVKLGIAAFLLPFIFVYQPVLLLVGSPWNILNASLSACIGVMALGCAVVGFIQTRLSPWERVSLIVGSVLLIIPGLTTDLMGLAFCGVPYLTQRFRCRGLAVELQKKRGMEMSRNPKEEA